MFRTSRGQTLLETILVAPVLLIMVFMIFWFARILLTRQQLQMAARYGTDLMVYTNMNESQITKEIQDYLCTSQEGGRLLEKSKIKMHLHIDRFPEVNIYNAVDVLTQFFDPLDHTSFAEVGYTIATPKIFSAWADYFGNTKIDKSLMVAARSEVLAGTGYYEPGQAVDIPGPPEHPAPQPEPSASGQPPGDEPAELPDIQNPGDIQPPTMGDVGGIVAQEAQQQAQEVVNEGINEVKSIFNVDKAVQLAKDLAAQAASTIANSAITSYFGF